MLAAVYIPSSIATIIRLRSGLIGSLRDERFLAHRFALDQTTMLFGAAFWGALLTCIVLWAIMGLVGFLIVWSVG
jgi:hypothetical protein